MALDPLAADLVKKANAWATKAGLSLATVSTRAVNDSTFFARVAEGRSFQTKTAKRALDFLRATKPVRRARKAKPAPKSRRSPR